MLSSYCNYRLNAADSLRSENYPTVEIGIVEIHLQRSVETLSCSVISPRWEPYLKIHEPQLLHLLGHGGPQVKMGH